MKESIAFYNPFQREERTVFYNHSQMEEHRLLQTPEGRISLLVKRLGLKKGSPLGIETPLGHAYSVFLQRAHDEGLDIEPNPQEAIQHIAQYLFNGGGGYNARELRRSGLSHPLFFPTVARGFADYVWSKGISQEGLGDMMEEFLGQRMYEFSPELNQGRHYKR